jgi:mitochondrial splicing suppressor protein 51
MDTERSRRHASKLLTYPITIGGVLHQHSGLTLNNQRLTPEGSRSLAGQSLMVFLPVHFVQRYVSLALRTTLHVAPGAPETAEAAVGKPQVRVFILGARAESSLPPHVWEQLCMLFPSTHFHLFFIGPQVSLPKPPKHELSSSPTEAGSGVSGSEALEEEKKPAYLPNIYEPPSPAPITRLKRTRSSVERYGVPSYTVPYTPQLTITGMQANYAEVHAQFQYTLDPYSDLFFLFSPGFGFPSPVSISEDLEPLLQIASPTEWGPVLPMLLASKCPIFVTGFSPTDVERDVRSLSIAPEVAGEFEWVITPGPNTFGSEKWEVADFDPRVMVKTNWGIWCIKGRSRDIREKDFSSV